MNLKAGTFVIKCRFYTKNIAGFPGTEIRLILFCALPVFKGLLTRMDANLGPECKKEAVKTEESESGVRAVRVMGVSTSRPACLPHLPADQDKLIEQRESEKEEKVAEEDEVEAEVEEEQLGRAAHEQEREQKEVQGQKRAAAKKRKPAAVEERTRKPRRAASKDISYS